MKTQKILWSLIYFLSPLLLVGMILNFPGSLQNPAYAFSVLTGSYAYVWLNYQFIISARPKFIERHFGMDNLYRFHGIMAAVSLGLGFIHRFLKIEVTGRNPILARITIILFTLTILGGAIFLVDSILLRIKPVQKFRKLMEQKLNFKRRFSVLLHNLTLAATIVLLMKVLRSASAFKPATRYAYIGFFALGISFYVYYKFIKPQIMHRNAYQVTNNKTENSTIQTLTLTPNNGDLIDYLPGQFAWITVLNKKLEKEAHPFTIASSPTDRKSLQFSIKASGDFTSKIASINTGDKVLIDAPYGVFTHLNHPDEKDLVFIAGGIGITPIMSMLRYLKDKQPNRKVTFLWGVRFPEELIFQEEMTTFEKTMPNFSWIPILSDDKTWEGEKGFVDPEKLQRLVFDRQDNPSELGFYICGPKIMMDLVSGYLKDFKIAKGRIHFEKFAF